MSERERKEKRMIEIIYQRYERERERDKEI